MRPASALDLNLDLDLDPTVPGFFLRPDYHDVLAELRATTPVRPVAPGVKLITRYHDIRDISRDPDRFCSSRGVVVNDPVGRGGAVARSILHLDPPEHCQWRGLLNRQFTPRALDVTESMIRAHAVELVEAIPLHEEVDIVDRLAAPLPLFVISELLGVPRDQRSEFRRWSDAMINAIECGDATSAEDRQSVGELARFLQGHIAATAEDPGSDILSVLVTSEIDGRKLTAGEILLFSTSLLLAGNETTRHLISGGIAALADHPATSSALRADPSLVAGAVEECLRWVTPVQQFARTATRPTELSGTPIAEGDTLVMLYASGNRDEDVFGPSASEFDPLRPVTVPNLAFGFGQHLCLGAALARMEARIVFEELLARRPACRVTGPGAWQPSTLLRGARSLPMVFG